MLQRNKQKNNWSHIADCNMVYTEGQATFNFEELSSQKNLFVGISYKRNFTQYSNKVKESKILNKLNRLEKVYFFMTLQTGECRLKKLNEYFRRSKCSG